MIYKELALDSSASRENVTRMKLIFLGEKSLISGLRSLHSGRRGGAFDEFFLKLEEVVDTVTAADERRHNVSHLSKWISLEHLMKEAQEMCPDGALIPSKSLVRHQFAPRNPYLHSALNFTGRIQVQYKIQRCQLRVNHEDQHYCAAQFKYFKEKAVEMASDTVVFCCDDKAKVPIGEPGAPIFTGVRGKKTIAPSCTTLAALDHDISKCSLTPSVYLQCHIPSSSEKSFVNGIVNCILNDSVFETSSPFRHAAALLEIIEMKADQDRNQLFLCVFLMEEQTKEIHLKV